MARENNGGPGGPGDMGKFGGGQNGGHGGGQYMPSPYGMPIMVVNNSDNNRGPTIRHAARPPERVTLAMEFLELMKTFSVPRAVLVPNGEHSAELKTLPPAGLTPDEVAAQAAAADVCTRYFTGKLPANIWEAADLRPQHVIKVRCACVEELPDGTFRVARFCPLCKGEGKMPVQLDPEFIQQQAMQGYIVKKAAELEEAAASENEPASGRGSRGSRNSR